MRGLIKQREIDLELICDILTGQYQSSLGLLRYDEFKEIYMKQINDRKLHNSLVITFIKNEEEQE